MCSLANSGDPGKMLHNAVFHQGLHCWLRQKRSSEKELQFYFEIITCDPSNYIMDHFKLFYQTGRKSPLGHKRLIAGEMESKVCYKII